MSLFAGSRLAWHPVLACAGCFNGSGASAWTYSLLTLVSLGVVLGLFGAIAVVLTTARTP